MGSVSFLHATVLTYSTRCFYLFSPFHSAGSIDQLSLFHHVATKKIKTKKKEVEKKSTIVAFVFLLLLLVTGKLAVQSNNNSTTTIEDPIYVCWLYVQYVVYIATAAAAATS